MNPGQDAAQSTAHPDSAPTVQTPRLRFRLRGLMIAIAFIATALAALSRPRAPQPVKATSPDPEIATRQEKVAYGVLWGLSYKQARERAERERRPILIFFGGLNDPNERQMEMATLPRPDVVPWLSRFVTVKLHIDYAPINSLTPDDRAKIAQENQAFMIDLASEVSTPTFAVTDARDQLIAKHAGYCEPDDFIAFLQQAESSYTQRTGANRRATRQRRAGRAAIVAAITLFAIWAVLRAEHRRKTERRMIDRPNPV